MDAVIILINKIMSVDELGYPIATEETQETFCKVGSISRSEFFNAGKAGLVPEYVFTVNAIEYSGQPECEYEGKRLKIYRTYVTGDYIELYAEYRSGVTDVDND